MPALLTSTSSLPKCLVVAATTAAQLSSLVTSSGSNRAEAPIASATCRPSCSSTSAITTLAPSRANMRAVAVPMPDAAPEMMATLSASLMAVLPFSDTLMEAPGGSARRMGTKNPCTLQGGYRLVRIVDWPDRAGLPGVALESPCFEHLERTCAPAGLPRRKSRGRLRLERQYRD